MSKVKLSLLRGVCQMPAYVAHDEGIFEDLGLDVTLDIVPTAWQIPDRLARGECDFAVLPWTRVALDALEERKLVLVCGSGVEEAAIVVREGFSVGDVRRLALPKRGGLKDLTAQALIDSLGWQDVEEVRQPLGDAAILALVGDGADAASMVEPFATVMEEKGLGRVVKRTGDVWPGAPGCSLTTTHAALAGDPDMVGRVVEGFVRAADVIGNRPDEAARVAAPYIGVSEAILRKALTRNRPDVHALDNRGAMDAMLGIMKRLGYVDRIPEGYCDLRFVRAALARI